MMNKIYCNNPLVHNILLAVNLIMMMLHGMTKALCIVVEEGRIIKHVWSWGLPRKAQVGRGKGGIGRGIQDKSWREQSRDRHQDWGWKWVVTGRKIRKSGVGTAGKFPEHRASKKQWKWHSTELKRASKKEDECRPWCSTSYIYNYNLYCCTYK